MIVPGSPFGINHPFSWYALVEDKQRHRWTYWFNGNQMTRETVADHIRGHYPNVRVVTIDVCKTAPIRPLQPIPPEHFQSGALKQAMGIVDAPPLEIQRRPISLSPLSHSRKVLWLRPH